jgi:hypothetical protein
MSEELGDLIRMIQKDRDNSFLSIGQINKDLAISALLACSAREIVSLNSVLEFVGGVEEMSREVMKGLVLATARASHVELDGVLKIPEYQFQSDYSHPYDRVVLWGRSYEIHDVLEWMLNICREFYSFDARTKEADEESMRLKDTDYAEFPLLGENQLIGLIVISPIRKTQGF